MKAAVVSSRLVAEHGRLDATYYLGDTTEIDRKIGVAMKTLQKTISRIRNLLEERAEVIARGQSLMESGEVVPIAGDIVPLATRYRRKE